MRTFFKVRLTVIFSCTRHIVLLISIYLFSSHSAISQDEVNNEVTVFIDPSKLDNLQLIYIYNSMLQAQIQSYEEIDRGISYLKSQKANPFEIEQFYTSSLEQLSLFEEVIKPADNLEKIVKSNYNFSSKTIVNSISDLNSIKNPSLIQPGDKLILPTLPKLLTDKGGSSDYYQFYDFTGNTLKSFLAESKTDSLIYLDKGGIDFTEQYKAGTIAFKFSSQEELQSFLEKIIDDPKKESSEKAIFIVPEKPKISNYIFSDSPSDSNKVTLNHLNSNLSTQINQTIDLSEIDSSYFEKIVVIDEFGIKPCGHGQKVIDVILQVAEQYNLRDIVKSNIIEVPIDFYQQYDESIKHLERYSSKLSDHERIIAQAIIKSIKKYRRFCQNCTPDYYLEAIFSSYYADYKPDIITSSFFVFTDSKKVIPSLTLNSATNLLTASPNDPGKLIEDYFESEAPTGELNTMIQPVYDYFSAESRFGTIIVGSQTSEQKLHGTISKDGTGVHVLGNSSGWGTDFSCIESDDIGNSFSTPEIATKLLIAKAFWKSRNLKVSPTEARLRLILSSEPKRDYITKIASAGPLNMGKLLSDKQGFIETTPGQIKYITQDESIYSYVRTKNGTYEVGLKTGCAYSGIYFNGEDFFVFSRIQRIWIKEDVIESRIAYFEGDVKRQVNFNLNDWEGTLHAAFYYLNKYIKITKISIS